jgi:hypothetical protein
MKWLTLVLLLAPATFAKLHFAEKKSGTIDTSGDLLFCSNCGFTGVLNRSDSIVSVVGFDVKMASPGVEWGWYLRLSTSFAMYSLQTETGEQRLSTGIAFRNIGANSLVDLELDYFNARNWGLLSSDAAPDYSIVHDTSYKKNTAKEIDTLNAQMIFYWYYTDYPRRDSTKKLLLDSTILDCRLQYMRGGLNPLAGIQRRHLSPVQMLSRGWKVPAGGRWTLRNLQGREIPLRQESTNDGVLLLPSQGLHGVGVLTGPNGQASKVHSLGGN